MARAKQQQRDYQAPIIKFSAVFAAVTRWTGALLAAEGFSITNDWEVWWKPTSALLSAFMAVVEGWAFAYVFAAWWAMRNKERQYGTKSMSSVLLVLTIFAAAVFVLVLTPYIAAQAQGSNLYNQNLTDAVLGNKWSLLFWSACVAASTISIVASVGIAQGAKAEVVQMEAKKEVIKVEGKTTCFLCNQEFKPSEIWNHIAMHKQELAEAGNLPTAIRELSAKYPRLDQDRLAEWMKDVSRGFEI